MSKQPPQEQCKVKQKPRAAHHLKYEKNAHTHTNIASTRVNYGKWQIVQTQHTAQHNICVSNLVFVIIVGAIDAHTLAALCTRATFRFRYSEYFVSQLSLPLKWRERVDEQKRNSITNEICLLAIWNAQLYREKKNHNSTNSHTRIQNTFNKRV